MRDAGLITGEAAVTGGALPCASSKMLGDYNAASKGSLSLWERVGVRALKYKALSTLVGSAAPLKLFSRPARAEGVERRRSRRTRT